MVFHSKKNDIVDIKEIIKKLYIEFNDETYYLNAINKILLEENKKEGFYE